MRDAYGLRDLLPEAILHRKKKPLPKTYNPNYEKLLAERLTRIYGSQRAGDGLPGQGKGALLSEAAG
jgi:hypothetical protein